MADTVLVPRDSLRTLAKWAYHSAEYDGAVSLDTLRSMPEPISELIGEIIDRDGERRSADQPFPFEQI
ncbi:hypothetical protein [Rhodococcoides kyotonense]|nr:hypothetical protein [Rhodococcus kyotonensis]